MECSAYDASDDLLTDKNALCDRVLTLLETQGRLSDELAGKILEVEMEFQKNCREKRTNSGFLRC